MVVRGSAASFPVNYLVDTGSQRTLITESLVADLKLKQHITGTDCVLSSFTNDKIETAGELSLELTVAGITATHRCIVVKHSMECDILLGSGHETSPRTFTKRFHPVHGTSETKASALLYGEDGVSPKRLVNQS